MANRDKLRKIKRYAQRAHFARRASERLGYDLSGAEITRIRAQVQSGSAELLARPSTYRRVYRVDVNGRSAVVIYDQRTAELVTFFTEEIWQNQKIAKSPDVEDKTSLRQSLSAHPMADELRKLRGDS